ncbi:hypothetical protein [Streptomyces sp. NBC_00233]|uniref:hypothetical protein n=1 Tax=Streptomyces sp. NBC_00233 TaxID=2975686 RepID=UPI002256EAE7|nr:hypothetical protein [Streptomyces sp. NBC_00233]MCX5233192.1 hypothetical protein [Streptomyces sp. NBC_00233]
MRFSKIARYSAAGLTAATLIVGLSACDGETNGGAVSKETLVAKLKSEPDFKTIPDAAMTCVAEVVLKYGDQEDLQGYVEGTVKVTDIKGLEKNKESEKAGLDCVTKAARK